jgi:hypothetical protein
MRGSTWWVAVLALAPFAFALTPARGGDGAPASRGVKLELGYDLYLSEGATINDASGHNRHGTLSHGQIVFGKRKNALEFDGRGLVQASDSADPMRLEGQALTVGALCKPATGDGVLASCGDATNGFSLYLREGIPHFAARSAGQLTDISDTEPRNLGQWCHLVGAIDDQGELWLLVDGWPVAHAPGALLAATPAEPFCVGADTGAVVGLYQAPAFWNGQIEDIRLYRGYLSLDNHREELKDWGDAPGCGCRD